jgi:hypothetical protein
VIRAHRQRHLRIAIALAVLLPLLVLLALRARPAAPASAALPAGLPTSPDDRGPSP